MLRLAVVLLAVICSVMAAQKCTTDALRVRSQPSTSGSTLRTLAKGASVNVISTSNGWSKIGNGQFVSAQYLKACGSAPAPSPSVGGGSNCGQAYVSGSPRGQKQCVNIDGKPVVTTTAAAFNKMKAAARAAGVTLRINSGFRTQAEQQRLYNCYLTKRCNNGNLAAKPGYSNHQNGIALDINVPSNVYTWLTRNASKYGFIRAVASETWHWEYRPGSRCNAIVRYSCN